MKTNEDGSTADVVENEDINTPPEDGTTPPEDGTTPPEDNTEESNDSDVDLIDSLLNDEEDTTEKPTEPKFFPKEEKKEEEKKTEENPNEENPNEEDKSDEEIIKELDESYSDMEKELDSKKEELTESEEKVSGYSEALDKLGDHPILGPLNAKILKGEEVDIPAYLQKSIDEDLGALPNMEEIAKEPTETNPPADLQSTLENRAKNRY